MKKIFVALITTSIPLSAIAQNQEVRCSADQTTIKNRYMEISTHKEFTFAFPKDSDSVRKKIPLADSEFDILTKRDGYIWLTIRQGKSSRSIVGSFAKESPNPRFIWQANDDQGDTHGYQRLECRIHDVE